LALQQKQRHVLPVSDIFSLSYLYLFKIVTKQLIFYKDNANERNESLLSDCRVQLIFYKDNANERNESLLSDCRVQLIFYKDKKNNSNIQETL